MPVQMTTRERVLCMLDHRVADRAPITDYPWAATLRRWQREGLPEGVSYIDYFGLDHFVNIGCDNSPRLPTRTIEETPEYRIYTTAWGTTQKDWRDHGGVPEFIDFTIVDRASWEKVKPRMTPSRDRIDWARLEREYPLWKASGAWIEANFWFGFDVTHSWMVGTERVLTQLVEDPEWLVDMWNTQLDLNIAMFEQVLAAGYAFDAIGWPDDMGYKLTQFFSRKTYQRLLKPVHARAAAWARSKGLKVKLHSCGDIRPFVPDLLEIGIDILNPIEVKAGMDPLVLKRQYGDKLVFHGGIDAALFPHPERLYAQMESFIPQMKEHGGYIFASDHSVPDSVSLEDFRRFIDKAKTLVAY